MAASGLDAFLLQRTDQHNSEYLPASEERVAWLTGFTGSNALVAITADQAAVFSDGRYTVQLADEVDASLYERLHIVKEPATGWLTQRLCPGQKLGLDPFLTKTREWQSYGLAAERAGAEVVQAHCNPVDEVWNAQSRPSPPQAQVRALNLRYSGEARSEKCQRMGARLGEMGADWSLITAADEIAWLLNIRGADIPFNPLCLSHLLLESSGKVNWYVDPHKLPDDFQLGEDFEIHGPDQLSGHLDVLGRDKTRVLADPASVHLAFSEKLRMAGAKVIAQTSPVTLAKAAKNQTECDGARRAQERDAAAITRFLAWIDQIPLDGSVTEMSAAARLADERSQIDLYQGPSFDTISAHGPHAALPHYRVSAASDRPLTPDTLYLVDSGGQYLDGTTDITRTIALGIPTAEMRTRFTAVLRGHIALARSVFPKGTHGGQLDTLARQPLWDLGLDFDHGTGHGVGAYLCVHEGPQRIAKQASGTALLPGMIVSNEPGYYKTGHYGIRIENLLIVEKRAQEAPDTQEFLGFETITWAPIDRRLVDPGAMTSPELEWLNSYHAEVNKRLSANLDATTANWLQRACKPIG